MLSNLLRARRKEGFATLLAPENCDVVDVYAAGETWVAPTSVSLTRRGSGMPSLSTLGGGGEDIRLAGDAGEDIFMLSVSRSWGVEDAFPGLDLMGLLLDSR